MKSECCKNLVEVYKSKLDDCNRNINLHKLLYFYKQKQRFSSVSSSVTFCVLCHVVRNLVQYCPGFHKCSFSTKCLVFRLQLSIWTRKPFFLCISLVGQDFQGHRQLWVVDNLATWELRHSVFNWRKRSSDKQLHTNTHNHKIYLFSHLNSHTDTID